MKDNFWLKAYKKAKSENRPITMVAPMADVTDQAFRYMIAKYSRMGEVGGGPDIMWNEFVSCDGLNSVGREVLQKDLVYNEIERPIIAQLFTSVPENMKKGASICEELGFDGIDINMGCPVDIIGRQGAGSALIKNPELAKSIILAAREGAPNTPISVKTRIGYNKIEYKEWLSHLLSLNLPALTIHLRTKKEMSKVDAHWELADEIYDFCKSIAPETIIIFNGDIKDIDDAMGKYAKYKMDGIMIGRGAFGKPYIFDIKNKDKERSIRERFDIMLEHTKLYEETVGKYKSFAIMKKHYKAYINGFDGAKELREKLFECNNYLEVKNIIDNYIIPENI